MKTTISIVFLFGALSLACDESSDDAPDGSVGPANVGGAAGTAADAAAGGMDASSASAGPLTVSTVAGCTWSKSTGACMTMGKTLHWQCPMNPGDAPPAAGCEKLAGGTTDWCCPTPFCSANANLGTVCSSMAPGKAKGYICADDTPGTAACHRTSATGTIYCCP